MLNHTSFLTATKDQMYLAPSSFPLDAQYPIRGRLAETTLGWSQNGITITVILLIAPTLVYILSMILATWTLWNLLHTAPASNDFEAFDLDNLLHILAAASVGELPDRFPEMSEAPSRFDEAGRGMMCRLRPSTEPPGVMDGGGRTNRLMLAVDAAKN